MRNVRIMEFRDIVSMTNKERPMGHLTPIEGEQDIPFEIKRMYYLTRVPENTTRGFHAHKKLEQILICMNGKVTISVSTPYDKQLITLDDPAKGLYIGPMIWREMYDFSPGSVLTVLASEHYNESDYIRDYQEYSELAQNYFTKQRG